MKYIGFILLVFMVITSSCNTDDVITVPLDENYRAATFSSEAKASVVFDYTPAAGQFIGDTRTGGFTGDEQTPADAVSYATQRLETGSFVSLGGFGGYIVVGFDHSIDNCSGYDFAVAGNSFEGSSEAGIVWVMQDKNGNGQPDDIWYELRGSESDAEHTIRDYAVTYYRPTAVGMPVRWTDNLGDSGEIDYLSEYHSQDSYYPAWIAADSYTLRGTHLEARNYDQSGNGCYWIQPAYDWGYADNYSSVDRMAEGNLNLFEISNAIDNEGNSVTLKYIDFVKVQTALNAKSGWLGENSTEVCGFYDYRMKQKK